MRHLREVPPVEIALMARAVIRAPRFCLLIATTRFPHRLSPTRLRALAAAVTLAGIAIDAEEEHLAAPAAHDETQRLHGLGRDVQKLGRVQEPCDD